MLDKPSYEILDGLPSSGPMYIPVAENGEKFYNEGLAVKFKRSDNSEWVANFKLGWTDLNLDFQYSNGNVLIIANGMGYIMSPESEIPISTFGVNLREAISYKNERFILADDTDVEILSPEGIEWQSRRIAWDGIKDLTIEEDILNGKAFTIAYDGKWLDFSINLKSKETKTKSYP